MSFRATQFTSAIDLLKAVNFCWSSLDFWCEGNKWCTLSHQEITQHGKQLRGILPLQLVNSVRNRLVCICFVTKPTKPIEWNLYLSILKLHCMKRATGVSELSTICSTGKIVYIQIIRTDLWSFCTLNGPSIRNNNSYAWNSCKQSTGKVKLISILYRLKLFTLILISFSTAKISYLEPDIIVSSGDIFYLTSAVSLEKNK